MRFGWPQITLLAILALNLGINLARHGERKNEKYNFFIALFGIGLDLFLLYMGGFFR